MSFRLKPNLIYLCFSLFVTNVFLFPLSVGDTISLVNELTCEGNDDKGLIMDGEWKGGVQCNNMHALLRLIQGHLSIKMVTAVREI